MLEVWPMVSIIGEKNLNFWPIVSIHRLKIFFLLTTIDLIEVFCCQSIIFINPINVFWPSVPNSPPTLFFNSVKSTLIVYWFGLVRVCWECVSYGADKTGGQCVQSHLWDSENMQCRYDKWADFLYWQPHRVRHSQCYRTTGEELPWGGGWALNTICTTNSYCISSSFGAGTGQKWIWAKYCSRPWKPGSRCRLSKAHN